MLTDQLANIAEQIHSLWFEMTLAIGAMLLLIAGLFFRNPLIHRTLYALILIVGLLFLLAGERTEGFIFGNVLEMNPLTHGIKLLFAASALTIAVFPGWQKKNTEFYFLLLSIIIGSSLMACANHLLIIYLAIELTSYASYIITCFNFQKRSFEAGMKYLLFGGVSSAITLYGISLIYGFTGTMALSEMEFTQNPDLLNLGILLFMGGLFFKASILPFHLWVPSTYQEAPTEAVAILAVVPKLAALLLLHRVFIAVDLRSSFWLLVLTETAGIATLLVGTLGAMRQTNVKRLIAYGAVAHSGFILATLFIAGGLGLSAFIWYGFIYAIMNLGIFYLISVYEQKEILSLNDYAGQGSRESYLGGLMVLVLISLIGLPPTAGFTIKFYLFSGMWAWYESTGHTLMLIYLIIAVISVVFSLFFYLKIPYYSFLKEQKNKVYFKTNFAHRLIATIFVGVLLWMFFSADILNKIVENINFIDW